MKKLFLNCIAASAILAFNAHAGEKTVMHCLVFQEMPGPAADLNAYVKATDDLARKIEGIRHIWRGPIMPPQIVDSKKFTGGLCMEVTGKTLLNLDKEPAYKAWKEAYSKIQITGSSATFDILGQ
jgi:hypothetical protein